MTLQTDDVIDVKRSLRYSNLTQNMFISKEKNPLNVKCEPVCNINFIVLSPSMSCDEKVLWNCGLTKLDISPILKGKNFSTTLRVMKPNETNDSYECDKYLE